MSPNTTENTSSPPPVIYLVTDNSSDDQSSKQTVTKKADVSKKHKVERRTSKGGDMGRSVQNVLSVLKRLHDMGIPKPSRILLAFLLGRKFNKGFTNLLSTVKSQYKGVAYPSSTTVTLTATGIAMAPRVAAPRITTNAEFHAWIKDFLTPAHAKIFEVLADGTSRDRVAVAEEVGNNYGKSFTNKLSAMKTPGLLEYPNTKDVRLADMCFPFGRD